MTDQATEEGKLRPRKGRRGLLGRSEPIADEAAATEIAHAASETHPEAQPPLSEDDTLPPREEIIAQPETELARVPSDLPEIPGPSPAPAAAPSQTSHKGYATMDKAIKTSEEIVAFSQGNIEALIKSSQIWTAGIQDLSKHIAATTQAHIDETMANVKALSTVKSIKEALELQTGFAKAAVEKAIAETSKLTDATVKLTEETLAPITARVTLATETFTRAA